MSNIRSLSLSASGMAFDPKTGESFQLNESAHEILRLLQDGLTVEEIAKRIAQAFKISHEQALTDVLEFEVQVMIMGLAA